jgi:hypothetical protein
VQTPGEDRAAAVDPDDREALGAVARRVLLDDLVCDAHERAPHVVAVEDDLVVRHRHRPSWPHGTGLKERGRD